MSKAPARGEVWRVNLDPTVGHEMRKVRPAVVISSRAGLELRLIVPITAWQEEFAACAWIVPLTPRLSSGRAKAEGADAFQTRSVSLRRFVMPLGRLTADELREIAAAVALCVEHEP